MMNSNPERKRRTGLAFRHLLIHPDNRLTERLEFPTPPNVNSSLPNCCLSFNMNHSNVRTLLTLAVLVGGVLTAQAHETDQYTMPNGESFADLGLWLSDYMYDAIDDAVAKTNDRIAHSLRDGCATQHTRDLQSPDALARTLIWQFPNFWTHPAVLERQLATDEVTSQFPGLVVQYRAPRWIYSNLMLTLDLTKFGRLARCSTIMADRSYFGTDKILHFCHMGYMYFREYRKALANGCSPEEATRITVQYGTGSGPLSENRWIGRIGTGVISNGDLAADYSGLKFYRNLTELVWIKGEVRQPILVREGEFYRFNSHIRRGNNFFRVFVSDHWNEALNPSGFSWSTRPWVEVELRKRCPAILDWYRNASGSPFTLDDFRRIAEEVSTYYGEDYGHQGNLDEMVTAANVCFDQLSEAETILVRHLPSRRTSSETPRDPVNSNICRCRAAPSRP